MNEKEQFKIDNDNKANWALRKIRESEMKVVKNNEFASDELAQEKERIETWQESVNRKQFETIDQMQSLLAEYAMNKKKEDPKFKSLKLPNGRFGFRKQQPKWNYDNDAVIKVLEDNKLNDFIRVKKAPDKAQIKKEFNVVDGQVVNPQTGEVIQGITVVDQDEDFNVVVE